MIPEIPERDCVFCKRIARDEFDYWDEWNVAFQPLNPVTPGHFLVVPRTHVSSALASPVHAGHALKFAAFLANQMNLGAANFITSAGAAATQTVPHLHLHIVPRREGDGLALPWTGQAALVRRLPWWRRMLRFRLPRPERVDSAHGDHGYAPPAAEERSPR